jgi:hypothetical protein
MSQLFQQTCGHAETTTDNTHLKRLLPLITAFILALYLMVPADLDSREDPTVAAVTELQDDVVYNNPRQDDNVLVPTEVSLSLLATAGSKLEPERVHNTFYRPSVPNIRDPPLLRAI